MNENFNKTALTAHTAFYAALRSYCIILCTVRWIICMKSIHTVLSMRVGNSK